MNTSILTVYTGGLYAVLAALGFALWNLFLQRALQRGAGVTGYLLALSLSIAGIFLPVALYQSWQSTLPALQPEGLLNFALAGVVTGALGPFHSTQATRRIGAAQTTAIRLLDPFFAFVVGLLFLGERIAGTAISGVLLIVTGLWLLQRSQVRADHSEGGKPSIAGILFAIGASILFTIGSAFRKAGLSVIPSPVLSVTMEGLAGVCIVLLATVLTRRWAEVRQVFSRQHRDVWLSGLSAAAATLFLNLALQRLALPVAVALRNGSPWFALLLGPLLLGARHKAGWQVWVSTLLLTAGMILILIR